MCLVNEVLYLMEDLLVYKDVYTKLLCLYTKDGCNKTYGAWGLHEQDPDNQFQLTWFISRMLQDFVHPQQL